MIGMHRNLAMDLRKMEIWQCEQKNSVSELFGLGRKNKTKRKKNSIESFDR
jgi:hypothetical protein